jgi:alpha-tubulin suppressor-like RCC1 family protein
MRAGSLLRPLGLALAICCFVLASLAAQASAASPGVFGWGNNEVGQLGNGTTTSTDVRSPVAGLSAVSALATGDQYSLALLTNGTVDAWGENAWGQLGDGTETGPDTCHAAFAQVSNYQVPCSTTPVQVNGLSGVLAIASGSQHGLALLSNGTVVAWGDNEEGQLGDGTKESSDVPVAVSGLSEVVAIAAAQDSSFALLKNGTVMSWGANTWGVLGHGSSNPPQNLPAPVSGLTDATAIAAYLNTGIALLSNGTVVSWGENGLGDLGDGTLEIESSEVPVPVSDLTGVRAIARGEDSLALLANGTVMAWGSNASGQLGIGTFTGPTECSPDTFCSTTPLQVQGLTGVSAISAGNQHDLALLNDGQVTAWGENWQGQLGDGSHTSTDVPVTVSGLEDATAIAAGRGFSLASGVPSQLPAVVSEVSPARGTPLGGTTVSITGSNFSEVSAVEFGSVDAASYTVNSESSITAVAPAGTGTVNVTVETRAGVSLSTTADNFTYGPTIAGLQPSSGPAGGGTSVTITGSGFTGATAVSFGSNAAASFTVNSDGSITAVTPAGRGTVEVGVTTPDGSTTTVNGSEEFSYEAPPRSGKEPVIDGFSASDITEHGAKLEAQINPNGSETTYEFWLEYGCETAGPGYAECLWRAEKQVGHGQIAAGDEAQTVSVYPTLEPKHFYRAWVVATNSAGETESREEAFRTPAKSSSGSVPAIESVSVSDVTERDATLDAEIDTEGLETTYQFAMWSICGGKGVCQIVTNYRLPSGGLLGSFAAQRVSLDLSSADVTLEAGGTYFYSLSATNAAGTTETHSQGFTTPEGSIEPLSTVSPAAPTASGESPPKTGVGGQSGNSSEPAGSVTSPLTPLVSPLVKTVAPKVLVKAQKLASALKVCKKEPRRKRALCERDAVRKYAARASKKR